jgi:NAD+ synthase (glutamine-hydrolysing)
MGPVEMFEALLCEWPHMCAVDVADRVKHFFRLYSVNRHKTTVGTPSLYLANYRSTWHPSSR